MVVAGVLMPFEGATCSEYRWIVAIWSHAVSRISATCDQTRLTWEASSQPSAGFLPADGSTTVTDPDSEEIE